MSGFIVSEIKLSKEFINATAKKNSTPKIEKVFHNKNKFYYKFIA